jgi:Ulp1 family protease
MFQPPFFWQSCQKTWEQKRLYPSLQVFLSDFNEVRESMQTLYFPVCSSGHWFLGIVSFQKKQISIADSLKADPPSNFYETIQYFLVTFLKIDVTDWRKNWVRESCPRQKDGHSCGVVVLSLLDYLCSEGDSDSWCPDMAMQFRVLWLRRLIEHDNQAMRCLLDLHLTNSKNVRL